MHNQHALLSAALLKVPQCFEATLQMEEIPACDIAHKNMKFFSGGSSKTPLPPSVSEDGTEVLARIMPESRIARITLQMCDQVSSPSGAEIYFPDSNSSMNSRTSIASIVIVNAFHRGSLVYLYYGMFLA